MEDQQGDIPDFFNSHSQDWSRKGLRETKEGKEGAAFVCSGVEGFGSYRTQNFRIITLGVSEHFP